VKAKHRSRARCAQAE
jgi:hypothetical protein